MTSKVEVQMAKAEVAYQKQLQLNLVELVRRYEQAIQRVRELHHNDGGYCAVCTYGGAYTGAIRESFPCDTVKALEGEQE